MKEGNLLLLNEKNIFITGANRGIGKAILTECAKNGANIFAHSRSKSEEFLKFIENLTSQYNVSILPIFFDLTDIQDIKKGLNSILKSSVEIDGLINNAGIIHNKLFQMTNMKEIRNVFEVNLFSHMELTQLILKKLRKGHQKYKFIINIASDAGFNLNVGNSAYGVSKAAMIAWTKVLSKELSSYNIKVNAIAPGLTLSNMSMSLGDKAINKITNSSILKRLRTPEEIANVAVFLASEKSSFINGQVIRVDGGSI